MNLSGKRILIVKPSSLGDVVHTLPLVHAVKRTAPSCHIGWIIQETFAGILESDPAIDEIIPVSIPSTSDPMASRAAFFKASIATFRALTRLRAEFRNRPYDVVLDLHASFRSGLLGMTNPNGTKIGFSEAKEFNTFFQNRLINVSSEKKHAVDRNLVFAEYLECPQNPKDFRLITSVTSRERVRSFLAEEGIGSQDRIVYANPAARWKSKLWTVEAWAELADLFANHGRVQVVFAGSTVDVPYIRSITERTKKHAVVAAGKLTLAESTALIEASDVYVGVDSGPMHIAAFAGTPVVAIFGPTDPAKVGPYGEGHRVIRHERLDCLACRKRSCGDHRCLHEITHQRVFDVTMELLHW